MSLREPYPIPASIEELIEIFNNLTSKAKSKDKPEIKEALEEAKALHAEAVYNYQLSKEFSLSSQQIEIIIRQMHLARNLSIEIKGILSKDHELVP